MKKKLTKYKNEVNTIPMRNWTVEEMNFFFAILTQLRDEGSRKMTLDKRQLAELANYSIEHNQRYRDTMRNLGIKISDLKYWENSDNEYITMPLFTYFKATWSDDLSEMAVQVTINEEFEYILNKWELGQWTTFELKEFTEINSTYSKTLFRLLKQWRKKGKREFTVDEFRNLLSVPNSYRNSHINDRIIKKALADLSPFFENLKVKVVKSNARGNPVIGYIFTFKPEKTKGSFVPGKFDKKDKRKKRPSPNPNKHVKPNNNYEDDLVDPKKRAEYEERLKRIREQNE